MYARIGHGMAGKGKSTQNIAIFNIKSTSSHLPHLLNKKRIMAERLFSRKLGLDCLCICCTVI